MTLPQEPNNREFMATSFGDDKLSKEVELNASMSIAPTGEDEYERAVFNTGTQRGGNE